MFGFQEMFNWFWHSIQCLITLGVVTTYFSNFTIPLQLRPVILLRLLNFCVTPQERCNKMLFDVVHLEWGTASLTDDFPLDEEVMVRAARLFT